MHPIFGRVHVVEKAPANLLSLAHIRDTFHVSFDDDKDRFVLSPKSPELQRITSPLVFPMHPRQGVYVYSRAASERYRQSITNIVASSLPTAPGKHYNPAQMKAAKVAQHLHEVLGHCSDESLCTLLDNGGILDCTISSTSVRLSREIFGPCPICMQTQMRDQSKYRESNAENISEPAEKVGDHFIVDIIFIRLPNGKKLTALLLLEELSNAGFVIKLRSKSQKALEEALYKAIGYFRAQNNRVTLIKSDHESNIRACSAFLGNLNPPVKYKSAAPGTHARRVERYTQVIRDKLRAMIKSAGLPIPPDTYYSLLLGAVAARNQVPNLNSGPLAPFQLMTQWKPSLKGSLRHKFGDLVIVKRPNIPASDKESDRGERAIYLYPNKGQNHATVRLLDGCSAGEIVSRDLNPRKMASIPLTSEISTLLDRERVRQGCEPGTTGTTDINLERESSPSVSTRAVEPDLEETWDQPERPAQSLEDFYPDKEIEETFEEINPMLDEEEGTSHYVPPVSLTPTTSSTGVQSPVPYSPPVQQAPVQTEGPPTPVEPMGTEATVPQTPLRTPAKTPTDRNVRVQLPERAQATPPRPPTATQQSSDFVFQPKPEREHRFPRAAQKKGPAFPVAPIPSYATAMTILDSAHHRTPDRNLPQEFVLNISLQRALKTMPDKAKPAILTELKQMKEMNVLEPEEYNTLSKEAKNAVIYAFLFLKEKYRADGTFDKFKARFVANKPIWSPEDASDSMDPSSPTVDFLTASLIINLICYRKMKTAIIDVKGAYLNADINQETHIIMDPTTTGIFLEEYPQYRSKLRRDGSLCCRVKKALYGLPQSGKLWYLNLRETLIGLGYTCQEQHDKCLFTCSKPDGSSGYILVYVDDLLLAADTDEELDRIITALRTKYKDLSVQRGHKYSWLGLTLEFASDNSSAAISQDGYILDILKRFSIPETAKAKSPCTSNFLQRPTSGTDSEPTDSTIFRSQLMAAAYLGIRTRPDLRFAVSHLASRSANPTKHDQKCLVHLYNYINTTRHYKLRIQPTNLDIEAFIDASFAIHHDGKGHTGIIVLMGNNGALYMQSSKQKLLGHHSTDCELIAFNDGLFTLEQIKGLYNILGLQNNTITVHQDNSSAIHIAQHGHGNIKRSKYMTVRVEHIKSAIENKSIRIQKCATEDMYSDMLTKPIYGKKLKKLISPFMLTDPQQN